MKPKVLIVDDNAGLIEGVAHCLSDEFECKTAFNISDGLLLSNTFSPDVVLLDIGLGDKIDGIDAIPDFKKSCKAKIIMFSSIDNKDVIQEALKNGADHYFVKSPNVYALIKMIKKYV